MMRLIQSVKIFIPAAGRPVYVSIEIKLILSHLMGPGTSRPSSIHRVRVMFQVGVTAFVISVAREGTEGMHDHCFQRTQVEVCIPRASYVPSVNSTNAMRHGQNSNTTHA